ncbi:3-oxoacyl-[acyl-carrier-protein] reductase [Candidatus Falkowbacteria bacterium]|nr:3-oxoacyl-[acyl-carrier-protein] reductase [Candidatus Falkowbacteria bacterium]
MKLLENKKALITGAARGIGKAIAIAYAKNGADVAITDLKIDDDAQALVEELKGYGVQAKAYASDASNFAACEELVKEVLNDFGNIDILVNNAGITRDKLLMRMGEDDWDLVLKVNLKSVFNMTKAIHRSMLSQRSGAIINMSSVVGLSGNAGQSNYSASKAGLIGFTKSIAKEFGARGIRCNAIAPGFIETAMTDQLSEQEKNEWLKNIPLRRAGKAEDVADISVFLASGLSSYVTGQVISVDGGMHM